MMVSDERMGMKGIWYADMGDRKHMGYRQYGLSVSCHAGVVGCSCMGLLYKAYSPTCQGQ